MSSLDCCNLTFDCCDCCSIVADCDCCPDCCGGGGLPGGIKFGDGLVLDGDTLKVTIVGGSNCTCQPYTLPTASESVKGGIKVGHSLLMTDESMNVALDTVPSTIEGFMWIHDVGWSVDPFNEGHFTKEDVDGVFS